MKRESESRTVNLPTEIYKRVKDRAEAANFESVDEYVIFVLSEVLKGDDEYEESAIDSEQEEVKKRLKALGYLD
jgi:Arc/MetJ-type ribon-helix-helix transcriptional regulator